MEKSASRIAQAKFAKLSTLQKHRVLAELAREGLVDGDLERFRARYDEMCGWAELDCFAPPAWLTPVELLLACRDFHCRFDPHYRGENLGAEAGECPALPWAPAFAVEIVMDQVRNAHNLGAVIRLVDNFGLEGVVYSQQALTVENLRCRKVARGAERWIPARFEPDLGAYLRQRTRPLVVLERSPEAIPLTDWSPPPAMLLLVGSETFGASAFALREADAIVGIPMHGFKKSMNVTHALAVVAHWIVCRGAARHGNAPQATGTGTDASTGTITGAGSHGQDQPTRHCV
ncbi:MAG: hypothetical protein HYV63_02045 [Candidatus Schekmanbacteria bacterium]|nr:hypothetical protein [Candidatus Schekmanbacteria bacterium]